MKVHATFSILQTLYAYVEIKKYSGFFNNVKCCFHSEKFAFLSQHAHLHGDVSVKKIKKKLRTKFFADIFEISFLKC